MKACLSPRTHHSVVTSLWSFLSTFPTESPLSPERSSDNTSPSRRMTLSLHHHTLCPKTIKLSFTTSVCRPLCFYSHMLMHAALSRQLVAGTMQWEDGKNSTMKSSFRTEFFFFLFGLLAQGLIPCRVEQCLGWAQDNRSFCWILFCDFF